MANPSAQARRLRRKEGSERAARRFQQRRPDVPGDNTQEGDESSSSAVGAATSGKFDDASVSHRISLVVALRPLLGLVFLSVVVVGAGAWIYVLELNPGPGRHGVPDCRSALPDDDLVHLAWRNAADAAAQLARWDHCDDDSGATRTLRGRAKDALDADRVLIGWLFTNVALAVWIARRHQRSYTAAYVGAVAVAVYVVADLYENALLRDLVATGAYDDLLPTVAALKFGAGSGAGAILLVAGTLLAGGTNDRAERRPPRDRARSSWQRLQGFVKRWARRVTTNKTATPVPGVAARATSEVTGGLGICCSGGGIRSAAFTLGALQALDEEPSVVAEARWMAAVSGGAYMATAWVTARDDAPPGAPAWGRRSPEEDHLRRHASYLAPGLNGKLWALTRFLFGFAVNLGAVAAAVVVVAIPLGWVFETGGDERAVGGTIALPLGGCIELGDGGSLIALPGESVRAVGGDPLVVADGPVVPPKRASENTATAEIKGQGAASITAGGPSPTTTSPAAGEGPDLPCAAQPVAESDDLPATVPGRTFEKGTAIGIVPGRTTAVDGRVAGCKSTGADGAPTTRTGKCELDDAVLVDLGPRSVLVLAPRAVLTLAGGGIIDESRNGLPYIVRACGDEQCRPWTPARWVWMVIAAAAAIAGVLGVTTVTVRRDDLTRLRLERWLKLATWIAALAAVTMWLLPSMTLWLVHFRSWLEDRLALSGVGILTLVAALLTQIAAASGKADAPTGRVLSVLKTVAGKLRPVLVRLAAVVVGPLLFVGFSLAMLVSGARDGYQDGQLAVVVAFSFWLATLGLFGDLNEWSLHPFYRERLKSAFAAQPRAVSSPFVPLPPPREDPLQEVNRKPGPDLVICAAANIADDRLTPPGRPAASWTFSRESIGSAAIESATLSGCYPPEQVPPRFANLTSAWTAVAVSGAAFSPAMGKMTRPERVLFALGNLRLGVWYPNPRYRAQFEMSGAPQNSSFDWDWYRTHHPRPWYLAKEALGHHKLRDPWVYVTDGGHYENLGLVELLRRGCTEIYCLDASGDQPDTFGTLSDAMRLARAELDIEIDIRPTPMKPDTQGVSRVGVWPGIVHYPGAAEPGWVVVAKLAVPRTAPFDVIDLARTLTSFPAHSTADQLYTDQKFEAYRALGEHLGEQARMIGGAIRALLEVDGMAVEDAVTAVQAALCALPDPTPCPQKENAERSDG